MAGFRLPCIKSLAASLNGFSGRILTGAQQQKQLRSIIRHRLMGSTASTVSLSSERFNDNVVYSRHEDCFLHNQTVVQRFFEQASLWPQQTAMVSVNFNTKLIYALLNDRGF